MKSPIQVTTAGNASYPLEGVLLIQSKYTMDIRVCLQYMDYNNLTWRRLNNSAIGVVCISHLLTDWFHLSPSHMKSCKNMTLFITRMLWCVKIIISIWIILGSLLIKFEKDPTSGT